jgi:ribokinase
MNRVFVLGNAAIDLSLFLPHLARTGETAVASAASRSPGGKGLNQAVVAARAGTPVRFCAPVGNDADAAFLGSVLADEAFAQLRLLPKPCPTDQSIVMVAENGENSIVTLCECADRLTDAEAIAFAVEAEPGDWLLLQGNLPESVTLAAVRASSGRVVLNAAPLRWPVATLLPSCAAVIVNRGEAATITGRSDPAAAASWLRDQGCAVAIVTLAADGCLWADAEGVATSPAPAVRTIDTAGAGDTFCGALVAHLAAGGTLRNALAAAQAAAALSVTRPGTFSALPTATELAALKF